MMDSLKSFLIYGDKNLEHCLSSMNALRYIRNSHAPYDIDYDGIMRAASTWYDIGVSLMKTCQHHGGMDVYLKRSEYDTVIDMIMQGMPMEFLTQYILLNDHHVGKVIMNASHLGKCVFNVIEEG